MNKIRIILVSVLLFLIAGAIFANKALDYKFLTQIAQPAYAACSPNGTYGACVNLNCCNAMIHVGTGTECQCVNCVPNSYRCSGNEIQKCSPNYVWQNYWLCLPGRCHNGSGVCS